MNDTGSRVHSAGSICICQFDVEDLAKPAPASRGEAVIEWNGATRVS